MIKPNRPKSLQEFLLDSQEVKSLCERIAFLKVEQEEGKEQEIHIVFNEGNRGQSQNLASQNYEQGVDIFPVLIDIVVPYDRYIDGMELRGLIRRDLGGFNGQLTSDREGSISFLNNIAPDYNQKTNSITFGSLYLFKQNYDHTS